MKSKGLRSWFGEKGGEVFDGLEDVVWRFLGPG
jgi:hypothetical protein